MAEPRVLGFGGLVRQLRAEAGLTQEELAEAASLSPRSVSDLERGIHRTARKDTAELLAGALGLAEPARPLFVAAARGRAPAEEVLAALREAAAPEGPAPGGPYLGLVPFEERDARLFYGRGELTDQLLRRLAERPAGAGILLVAGESGSGKSSLLRAGLLPRLAAGALGPGSQRWPRRVIRPSGSPLRELAMALAEMAGADPVSVYRSLRAAPDEAPMLAGQAARTTTGRGADPGPDGPASTAAGATPRLVLVVDQFEELFTTGEDGDVDAAERKAFVTALHAAATVPAGPRGLPPALVVAAVRADYLGRLIAYPPLKAALDARLFADGRFARRRCRRADLTSRGTQMAADIEAAIDVFSAQRLLVLGEDSVEIAHDALLEAWKQLRDWLGDDQLDRALYSQVITDAATWDSNGRDPAYLYRPGRLDTIDAAAARWQRAPARYPPLPATSEAFFGAAHHAARRAARRRRSVIAGLLALTVIAISAAGLAVRDAAVASRQAANAAVQHAIALSRQLATESLAADPAHPLTARRLAVAAWHVFPTDQAGSALASLLIEQQQRGILPGDPSGYGLLNVAFSPDGTLLAAAYSNGYARLWNPATGQPVGAPLPADPGKKLLGGVAFSPDGTLLAAAYSDGYARLWNPVTGQAVGAPLPASAGSGGSVSGVAFSPDGKLLASADADGTVRMWQMPLFPDPYAALCADVGPPTRADWAHYAPGEPQPSVC